MNNQDQANAIIAAAKLEAKGKDTHRRLAIYDKYKYKVYDLVALGEERPYIKQLLDALKI